MNKILLDSDVIINILKKEKQTLEKLRSFKNPKLFTTPINIAEIYAGALKKEITQIKTLFSYFQILDINEQIGEIGGNFASTYKKSHNKISLEDFLIAATSKHHKISLWTYNTKHYPMDDINIL